MPTTRILQLGSLAPLAAAALAIGVTACGTANDDSTTTLSVYAAASLKPSFEQLEATYEAEHDGVDVELHFAGSSDLAAQIQQGAPADVFASADTATMQRVVEDDLVSGGPVPFAANTLQVVVPPGNPAGITTLGDLEADDVQVVVCAPQVPCGALTEEVARHALVDLRPVSEEQSVADVLAKVAVGEADAGLVYETDVRAADDRVEGVRLPEASGAATTYPIAVLRESDVPDLAQEFVDLVVGATGRSVLDDAGFGRP